MRYPEFIKAGDTIGFVAPSFGCAMEPYISAFEIIVVQKNIVMHPIYFRFCVLFFGVLI